ncbi:hypothetical protein [Actinacidiphila acididurans]|uniref:Uncharacterized protein n=1 Tax=Actinacidiphila acididurans TaxID=2784346 RepID=A0ABS2TLR9_9ACTN|nr:hypothetical protein [Actinacidiphila acididurans]MBM9504284.1 hypothetical protein [Actinacidiphila acididurans]
MTELILQARPGGGQMVMGAVLCHDGPLPIIEGAVRMLKQILGWTQSRLRSSPRT